MTTICGHCGLVHSLYVPCPRIKAIEYYENGAVKRIEYWSAEQMDEAGRIALLHRHVSCSLS